MKVAHIPLCAVKRPKKSVKLVKGQRREALGAIKKVGGITIAQKPDTASSPGMPESAIESGNIDFILSPREIAQELVRIAQVSKAAAA